MEDILFTVEEVAAMLKCSKNYVYELINKGFLKCLKLGRYKVRKVEILRFLEENEGKDLTDLDNVKDLNVGVPIVGESN